MQFCHDEYRRVHGICPTVLESRDGTILKRLIRIHGEELVRETYRRFVRSTRQWHAEKGWGIPTFAQDFDAFRKDGKGPRAVSSESAWKRMEDRIGSEVEL